jgi:hypothetical protein
MITVENLFGKYICWGMIFLFIIPAYDFKLVDTGSTVRYIHPFDYFSHEISLIIW